MSGSSLRLRHCPTGARHSTSPPPGVELSRAWGSHRSEASAASRAACATAATTVICGTTDAGASCAATATRPRVPPLKPPLAPVPPLESTSPSLVANNSFLQRNVGECEGPRTCRVAERRAGALRRRRPRPIARRRRRRRRRHVWRGAGGSRSTDGATRNCHSALSKSKPHLWAPRAVGIWGGFADRAGRVERREQPTSRPPTPRTSAVATA